MRTISEHFDVASVEAAWRQVWEREGTYVTPAAAEGRTKMYVLDFFPYPSGDGLSVGHAKNYVPTDVLARYYRMRGFNVLHPMGWDAFGLPAENEALLRGRHPRETIREYSANYKRQLQLLGCSYDWSREFSTSEPAFYRWTQWMFLLLLRRGLAYRAVGWQWWCPRCRTILANEQVVDGCCWRHADTPVEQKALEQWYVRTTAYADRLLADLDGLDWPESIKTMQRNWIGRTETRGSDGPIVQYRMHDWLISRQRFWGAPIPVVYCDREGIVPVPDDKLPVLLPEVDQYETSGTGRSPLDAMPDFVHTSCPRCHGPARRETDTLDGFADSNWYFLRFASPQHAAGPWDPDAAGYWLPVDWYVGGAEHAVMHLLYARFFTKVLADAGLVAFDEPFVRLRTQGSMLSPDDGTRMSKSRGNVVTPDEVVERYGADALRAAVLFIGPFDRDVTWDPSIMTGVSRFVRRLAGLFARAAANPLPSAAEPDPAPIRARLDHLVESAGEAIQRFRFNTLVAELMAFTGDALRWERRWAGTPLWHELVDVLVRVVAPLVPFTAEEAWHRLGRTGSVHRASWPEHAAPPAVPPAPRMIVVTIDGRVRDRFDAAAGTAPDALIQQARARAKVSAALTGVPVADVVVVPDRLVNFVTRERRTGNSEQGRDTMRRKATRTKKQGTG
ncbi:MAG TPA: leucine--tRNA ligase [bacterium]